MRLKLDHFSGSRSCAPPSTTRTWTWSRTRMTWSKRLSPSRSSWAILAVSTRGPAFSTFAVGVMEVAGLPLPTQFLHVAEKVQFLVGRLPALQDVRRLHDAGIDVGRHAGQCYRLDQRPGLVEIGRSARTQKRCPVGARDDLHR